MKNEPISRIMTAAPATISPASSVAAAERLMRAENTHHLPVVEDGRLVGMMSASGLLKAFVLSPASEPDVSKRGGLLEERLVSEVMHRQAVALPQTATFLDAAQALATGDVHALAVVAPGGVLAGIVTSTDLIAALAEGLRYPVSEPEDVPADSEGAMTRSQASALRNVFRATVYYLESGCGEIEYERLLQAVNGAREVLTGSELHL